MKVTLTRLFCYILSQDYYYFFLCVSVSVSNLTGISIAQSSARHSLVTQCRKTVDIFWFLCFTKRNTSKAKRPIWLFPFSNTVVWGSFSQLVQKTLEKTIKTLSRIVGVRVLHNHGPVIILELPKEKIVTQVIIRISRRCGVTVVHQNVPSNLHKNVIKSRTKEQNMVQPVLG